MNIAILQNTSGMTDFSHHHKQENRDVYKTNHLWHKKIKHTDLQQSITMGQILEMRKMKCQEDRRTTRSWNFNSLHHWCPILYELTER